MKIKKNPLNISIVALHYGDGDHGPLSPLGTSRQCLDGKTARCTHGEAVVDILCAGLCNAGIRQVHLVEDKGLQRRGDEGEGTKESRRISLSDNVFLGTEV